MRLPSYWYGPYVWKWGYCRPSHYRVHRRLGLEINILPNIRVKLVKSLSPARSGLFIFTKWNIYHEQIAFKLSQPWPSDFGVEAPAKNPGIIIPRFVFGSLSLGSCAGDWGGGQSLELFVVVKKRFLSWFLAIFSLIFCLPPRTAGYFNLWRRVENLALKTYMLIQNQCTVIILISKYGGS